MPSISNFSRRDDEVDPNVNENGLALTKADGGINIPVAAGCAVGAAIILFLLVCVARHYWYNRQKDCSLCTFSIKSEDVKKAQTKGLITGFGVRQYKCPGGCKSLRDDDSD